MRIGKAKDGGPESRVTGWFFEVKSLFSVVLLRFDPGTRDAYHGHAFNAMSWLLTGMLVERLLDGNTQLHRPSLQPIITPRSCVHQVASVGTSWVLSFRGPWASNWCEVLPDGQTKLLAHGRVEVG